MKLEDQVCIPEQSKKLIELGVKAKSYFYWVNKNELWKSPYVGDTWVNEGLAYPAYTVAELGEMLPSGICQTDKCPVDYGVKEWALYLAGDTFAVFMNNEAQARAAMLIHLIETRNLTPPQS